MGNWARGCVSPLLPGPPLGGLRAPKGTPKSPQGRGQYEASDLKLTQTKASELNLHSFFPKGHWSSRAEAKLAKRKQLTGTSSHSLSSMCVSLMTDPWTDFLFPDYCPRLARPRSKLRGAGTYFCWHPCPHTSVHGVLGVHGQGSRNMSQRLDRELF